MTGFRVDGYVSSYPKTPKDLEHIDFFGWLSCLILIMGCGILFSRSPVLSSCLEMIYPNYFSTSCVLYVEMIVNGKDLTGEVGDNMDPKSANSTGNTADKGKGTDSEQVPMDLDDQEKKSTDVTDKEAVRTQKRKLRESEADSEAQKSPSKVGYTMKPEDHLVAVRHSPSMTSPTNISNQAISSKSPKAKKTHSSSRSISTDTQGDLKDAGQSSHGDDPLLGGFWFSNLTRASVPVGTLFQTELPEFSKNAYEGDTKWLGTLIWPQGQVVVPSVPPTGFGRRDQCTCVSRGSSECVRFHLSEERNRLNLELGMSFDQFRFDTMGEAAASSWSSRDQTRFEALMRTNPPNADGKVWNKIRGRFRAKRMDQLVSYYFNVYQIRRHRQNPHDTDSDDDIISDKYLKL